MKRTVISHARIFKRGNKSNPSYGVEIPKRHITSGEIDPEKPANLEIEQKEEGD